MDVVVVEEHRRADRGQEPADGRVAPALAVQLCVLLEVGDFVVRRLGDVSALADEGPGLRGVLVGVDLIPEHADDLWPLRRVLLQHAQSIGAQSVVAAAPLFVLVLGQAPRLVVRRRHPARSEGDPDLLLGVDRPDQARRMV